MTNLKSQLQIVLQDAKYMTWLVALDDLDIVGFEDDAVMGFSCIFKTVKDMLTQWRRVEELLLLKHSSNLQKGDEKVWNIYMVFLCEEVSDETQSREVRWIEENLDRTRKLASCGIVDASKLRMSLLPLLPIQNQPSLDRDDFNVTQRLTRRIGAIAPAVVNVALDEKTKVNEVIRLLGIDL